MTRKTKSVYYEATQAEQDAIDAAVMAAAWRALLPLRDECLPEPQKTLACLRAFRAVKDTETIYSEMLLYKHPECQYLYHHVEAVAVVCSAIAYLDLDHSEIPHSSRIGIRLSALINAAHAFEAMNRVEEAFDPDFLILGTHLTEEIERIAEACMLDCSRCPKRNTQ